MAAKKKKAGKSKTRTISPPSNTDESVNVRKIENGFIVRKTSHSPRGAFKESEFFSETNPLSGMKISKPRSKKKR